MKIYKFRHKYESKQKISIFAEILRRNRNFDFISVFWNFRFEIFFVGNTDLGRWAKKLGLEFSLISWGFCLYRFCQNSEDYMNQNHNRPTIILFMTIPLHFLYKSIKQMWMKYLWTSLEIHLTGYSNTLKAEHLNPSKELSRQMLPQTLKRETRNRDPICNSILTHENPLNIRINKFLISFSFGHKTGHESDEDKERNVLSHRCQ